MISDGIACAHLRTMRRIAIMFILVAACTGRSTGDEPCCGGLVQLGGTYRVANRLDLASAGVLPDLASTTLEALSKLKDDPAGAIFQILQASNAPVVSTLLSVLPDVLKQQLATWFDDYVFAQIYQGLPVTMQIAGIIDDLASLVTAFQLDTALRLSGPDAMGHATARHALTGMTFTVADHSLVVIAPELLSDLTHADLDATALHIEEHSPTVEDGILDLDDHMIGVPLGDYIIHGLDQWMMQKFGQPNLRAALGMLVDCGGLAHNVASKCIGPVCVGHETEVKNVCEAGLDAIALEVETELKQLSIRGLHFKAGEAKMWDAPTPGGQLDGAIDRIDDGVWELGIDLGTGEHGLDAHFTGTRLVTPNP